jgi:hypothetical protein
MKGSKNTKSILEKASSKNKMANSTPFKTTPAENSPKYLTVKEINERAHSTPPHRNSRPVNQEDVELKDVKLGYRAIDKKHAKEINKTAPVHQDPTVDEYLKDSLTHGSLTGEIKNQGAQVTVTFTSHRQSVAEKSANSPKKIIASIDLKTEKVFLDKRGEPFGGSQGISPIATVCQHCGPKVVEAEASEINYPVVEKIKRGVSEHSGRLTFTAYDPNCLPCRQKAKELQERVDNGAKLQFEDYSPVQKGGSDSKNINNLD